MSEADRIRAALAFVPADDRETWVRIGMAIKADLNGEGFDVWDNWSQQAESYDPRAARDVWRSITPGGGVSIGTLYREAREHGWRDDCPRPNPAEQAERQRIAAEREAQEQAETQRQRKATAAKAAAVWNAATPAQPDNPYLVRKQVAPTDTLREIDAGKAAAILGYAPKSGGELLTGRLLVVPVKQGGDLATLELIDGDKRKTALAGRGTKAGGYWATGRIEGEGAILLGEGVATVLSASEATGHPGIAALSSGNLKVVAKAMRERYPGLVVLADLVKATGEPDPHAREAAQAIDGKLAVPDFGPDREPGMTDFNDLAVTIGMEAVRRCLANASAPAATPPQPRDEIAPAGESECDGWPDPLPLAARHEREPYPLDGLPDTVRAAVEEVAGFVKAPAALVASSALAALSLACQAHIDAKRAEKLCGPTGLFLLSIADSGERKSTCDGFFTAAIRQYQEEQAEAAKPILKRYKADLEAWDAKRAGIKDKIRHLAKDGKPTDGMESALRELEHDKPEPPRVPRLMYADATPEALAHNLAKQWPSGGVVSAEAGIVFGSHGMGKDSVMRNLATLNQLWDGASLTIDRRTSESFTVQGARLTMALQVQEPTLREFFSKSGALARGSGFLARFLVAWPASTQGQRPFTEAPANWPALAAFNQRLAAILNQPAPIDEDGTLAPVMLSLAPDAKAAWIAFHDAIESELASGGELYDVRDVASKCADNAARLAALFQMFEHGTGAVSFDNFERASCIAAWHLSEARRFFGELALPAELADAARLDGWLLDYCKRERTRLVPIAKLQQGGPGRLRSKAAIETALRELEDANRARLRRDGKRKMIAVNPALVIEGDAS